MTGPRVRPEQRLGHDESFHRQRWSDLLPIYCNGVDPQVILGALRQVTVFLVSPARAQELANVNFLIASHNL